MRIIRWLLNLIEHVFGGIVGRVEGLWLRNRPLIIMTSLIALFVFIFFFSRIVVFVNAGEAAVKFRRFGGGTVVEQVYGEGIHLIFPWDYMYVYNVRVQERDHEVELLSREGLKVRYHLSIRYFPEEDMLGVLHQRIGPEYVDKIVIPGVVSVLRTYVGQYTAPEVYTSDRAIQERIFSEAIDNIVRSYITINRVIIRTIELPPLVEQAVEEKIEQRHIAEAYEFRLLKEQKEAKRKEIEAEGYRNYNQIISESLTSDILRWKGIEATRELSTSENSKVIVVGNGDNGLPIILGAAGQ